MYQQETREAINREFTWWFGVPVAVKFDGELYSVDGIELKLRVGRDEKVLVMAPNGKRVLWPESSVREAVAYVMIKSPEVKKKVMARFSDCDVYFATCYLGEEVCVIGGGGLTDVITFYVVEKSKADAAILAGRTLAEKGLYFNKIDVRLAQHQDLSMYLPDTLKFNRGEWT